MRGSLAEFTLTQLLQLFGVAERTGSITVDARDARVQLMVDGGRMIGLDFEGLDLREALLSCELLPSASRSRLEEVAARGDATGLTLLARNVVEPERWDAFTQRQLEQHVYPLLNTEQGDFEVVVGRCPPAPLRVAMPIQQLILDATRCEADTEALAADGYRATTIWRRATDAEGSGLFSATQWLIWAIAAEPTSIGEAARRLCLPELLTAGDVKRLRGRGLLEVVPA